MKSEVQVECASCGELYLGSQHTYCPECGSSRQVYTTDEASAWNDEMDEDRR